jgi:hypothetical protein
MADVQFEVVGAGRGVGDREAAALAVGEQEVDVLAGDELEFLGGRQLDLEDDHVIGTRTSFCTRQGSFLTWMSPARLTWRTSTTRSERGGRSTAGPCRRALGGGGWIRKRPIHLAGQHLALAHPAGAVAAAVGKQQAGGQGGFENGFVSRGGEFESAGLEGDLERHDGWP